MIINKLELTNDYIEQLMKELKEEIKTMELSIHQHNILNVTYEMAVKKNQINQLRETTYIIKERITYLCQLENQTKKHTT